MSLVKGNRYLLKHANCVDDGLPLINCILTCSESEVNFKCFYVQKVSTFYLIFLSFGYLKKSVGDGAIKMHLKNVWAQTESRVRADTVCLAQLVVPLHSKSLSAEKFCSNAMTQKESCRGCFGFLLELTSVIIKIERKRICLVNLPVLPLQYYHPVLFFALYTWARWFKESQFTIS